MIIEESVFRVYDRLLWACASSRAARDARLASAPPSGPCASLLSRLTPECSCLSLLLLLLTLTLATLATLHSTYVGVADNCLHTALALIAANATGDLTFLSAGRAQRLSSYFNATDVLRVAVYATGDGADATCMGATDLLPGAGVTSSANVGLSSNLNFTPSFLLSGRSEGVTLPQALRAQHAFAVYNVCMPSSCWLRGGGDVAPVQVHTLADNALTWLFVAFDDVLLNAAMYALCDRGGFALSAVTGESWDWAAVCAWETSVTRPTDRGRGLSFLARVGMLLQGLLAYAFASSISALLVRVIVESGAAALYPCLSMLRVCCCAPAALLDLSRRDVNNAYPWIGMNVAYLHQAGASISPIISAHLLWIAFIVVIFSSSSAAVVGGAIYGWKSFPAGLSFGVMALFAGQEYFAFVFVRTRESIVVFARGSLMLFMAFHMYAVAYPYPFTDLAVAVWALALLLLMLVVLIYFELPAYMRGDLSLARPRHASAWLAGPVLPHQAPPMWSIFHVVNAALVGSYDLEVPARAPAVPQAGGDVAANAAQPPEQLQGHIGAQDAHGGGAEAVAVLVADAAPAVTDHDRGLVRRPLLSSAEFHSSRTE